MTVIALTLGYGSAKAQDLSVNLSNNVTNKNMFFGMNFGDKPMNQFYAEINKGDITGSLWTNYDLKHNELIETDFKIKKNQSTQIGDATLTFNPAFAIYAFPNSTMDDAYEVMVEGSLTGTPVDLSYKIGKVYGKDSGEGFMGTAGISKTVEIAKNVSIAGKVEATYLDHYFCEQKGMNSIAGTAGVTWTPVPEFNINASITTQKRTNDAFKDIVYNESWGNITFNYSLK